MQPHAGARYDHETTMIGMRHDCDENIGAVAGAAGAVRGTGIRFTWLTTADA